MLLVDNYNRKIDYLRLSVTDRCNLGCSYCRPISGQTEAAEDGILGYDELLLIAEAAVEIGVEKIRVTGGEPLLRKGITGFLERLAAIEGLKCLALTSNGTLLKEMSSELLKAGLESLNISLDSLNHGTYGRITRGGSLDRVLEGLEAAVQAGFRDISINVVIMRGINDHEAADFAALTMHTPYKVRFIEYMPTLQKNGWQSLSIPAEELKGHLSALYGINPVPRAALSGPADYYRISGAKGMIGFITPMSDSFCHKCNRLRVTSSGHVKSCLFADDTINLLPHLENRDRSALKEALYDAIKLKPQQHPLGKVPAVHIPFCMSRIGG